MMRIDVVTIFPAYVEPLRLSLVGKAIDSGIVDLRVHDLRDFTHDRHRTVDDTPYGGGPGMVMSPVPWGEALDCGGGLGPGPTPHAGDPDAVGNRVHAGDRTVVEHRGVAGVRLRALRGDRLAGG